MGAAIRTLSANLVADTGGWDSGLKKAGKALDDFAAKASKDLQSFARVLTDGTRTPLEQFKSQASRIDEAFGKGLIDATTRLRALGDAGKKLSRDSGFDKLRDQASHLFKETRTPLENYKARVAEIGKLSATGLVDGVTKARAMKAAWKDLAKEVGPLEARFGGVGKALRDVGVAGKQAAKDVAALGVGMTVATAAAGMFAKGGLDRLGDMGKASASLGVASDKLGELRFAARSAGVSADDLDGFLKGLNSTVHESIGRITPASEAFAKLGTSAEELSKLSPDQQFERLKAGFDALPDAAAKADAAVRIGGEAGLKLFRLLGMSADEFEKAKKRARDTGFAMKPEDLARVQQANDAFAKIGLTIEAVQNQLSVALAPAIAVVGERFNDWFSGMASQGGVIPGVIKTIGSAVSGLGAYALKAWDDLKGFGARLKDEFNFAFDAVKDVKGMIDEVLLQIDKLRGKSNLKVGHANNMEEQLKKLRPDLFPAPSPGASGPAPPAPPAPPAGPFELFKAEMDKLAKEMEDAAKKMADAGKDANKAATINTALISAVAQTNDQWRDSILTAGMTAEQKQIAGLKGISDEDRKHLEMIGPQVREAGKRDALAEDLRESTKLPAEKLKEDLGRIGQLLKEGKITQAQAIRGAAAKTADSGLGGAPKFAGALQANSIEGRSYLLSQMHRQANDPVQLARQGLALTGKSNDYLGRILNAIQGGPPQVAFTM